MIQSNGITVGGCITGRRSRPNPAQNRAREWTTQDRRRRDLMAGARAILMGGGPDIASSQSRSRFPLPIAELVPFRTVVALTADHRRLAPRRLRLDRVFSAFPRGVADVSAAPTPHQRRTRGAIVTPSRWEISTPRLSRWFRAVQRLWRCWISHTPETDEKGGVPIDNELLERVTRA